MSDEPTSPDGYPHQIPSSPRVFRPAGWLDACRAQTEAILAGTDEPDDTDPHAAGVHLGAVLKASGTRFEITWDTVAPGLTHVTADRTLVEHVTAAGVEADQVDVDDDRVSYLLTGPQCRAVAAAVEKSWGDEPGT